MERRFTGILLPILIGTLVYLLFFSDSGSQQQQQNQQTLRQADTSAQDPEVRKQIEAQPSHEFQAEGTVVRHVFGEQDGRGFTVQFSRYGAALQYVALNDHYMSAEQKRAQTHLDDDHYPLVPYYTGRRVRDWPYGLVLEGRGKHRFAKAIDAGPKNQLWEMQAADPNADQVTFRLDMGDGLVLEKIYSYETGRRDLVLEIRLRATADPAAGSTRPAVYGLRMHGVHLWNPTSEHIFMGSPAYAIGEVIAADGAGTRSVIQPAEAGTKDLLRPAGNSRFGYAATTNRFFAGALIPADAESARAVEGVATGIWPPQEAKVGDYTILARSVPEIYLDLALPVPAKGSTSSLSYRLYLGPKSDTIFEEQPEYAPLTAITNQDVQPIGCCSYCFLFDIIDTLATGLIWVLTALHSLVGSWGWAIFLLTLIVRMILSPLNFNMQRTMRAHGAKMAKLKPKMEEIQKRHKDDPKALQMEMMKFNKEHQLLSAPLKGCLPILVTMPIWFGLFTCLRVMYELRQEDFLGFISDLSQPDRLIDISSMGISWLPAINILPIIMTGLWLYLQMGTPLPKDPQQRQMMAIMRFMPIMMGIMLFNYAAALMVYMCTSSIWGIVEQKITKKLLGPVDPDAAGAAPMPMM